MKRSTENTSAAQGLGTPDTNGLGDNSFHVGPEARQDGQRRPVCEVGQVSVQPDRHHRAAAAVGAQGGRREGPRQCQPPRDREGPRPDAERRGP